jgi:glycosyltransferase involved in cell wall biosynthesis
VYLNETTVGAVATAALDSLGDDARAVLVVDASPDRSAEVARELASTDSRVDALVLDDNVGQHRAILTGLAHRHADWYAVLDADGQDPPSALPMLIDAARDAGTDIAFAGRRGRYEGRGRLVTSALYKRALAGVAGVPVDAGACFVCTAVARDALLALDPPNVVAGLGRTRLRSVSIPVQRSARPDGSSAYGPTDRLRAAVTALRWSLTSARR